MCGNHRADGSPVDHHHAPVFRPRARTVPRRAFLGDVGRGTVALAIFTPVVLASCGSDSNGGLIATTTTTSSVTTTSTATTTTRVDDPATDPDPTVLLRWGRTNLGFVSAYLLVRGMEAAIVDTGTAGSAPAIGDTLSDFGLGYADVAHVILTHHHPDHIGSINAVLELAATATTHAGEADLDEIALDSINPLLGGEEIFGLEVLATPGHTDGHISVIDHDTGLLVAGDAINALDGGVQGPNPAFSTDIGVANDSVRMLAELSFNTLLVGHGDPVEGNADTAVFDLAASLT